MRIKTWFYNLHPYVLSSVASLFTVAQIILAFTVKTPGFEELEAAGWICLWTAGIFGVLPIFTLRNKGGVPDGQSYIKTTILVESGIYGIVRHPQNGTAWLLINLGLILITRHWISLLLGSLSMLMVYADTYKSDRYCMEKFGKQYDSYMERVPRVNFVLGIIRRVRNG